MPEMRSCDAPDCEVQIRRGVLMCRTHWYMLPPHLRRAINSSWRHRRTQGLRTYAANVREARSYLALDMGAAR